MRRGGLRLLASAAAAVLLPSGAQAAAPQRIMSTNLCTDMLLVQLVPKSRIVSMTYLADDAASALFGQAPGLPVNRGTAEDVLRFRPDLILAGDFNAPAASRLAERVGARVTAVPTVTDFAGVRRIVRQVGAAVGEPARAEALVREMDAKLAGLAAHPPARRWRVVAWSGGTTVPGQATLANAVIEAAGATNVAARPGISDASFDVEQLLAADPDALLDGATRTEALSLQAGQARSRVVRRRFAGRRIAYDAVPLTCGLPQSADAAVRLRRALEALPSRGRP